MIRCRQRRRTSNTSNRPKYSVQSTHQEAMRARPRRGATSPGPTRPASHCTTASSTTVTATAGPHSPRAKIARVSPTRTTAATSQRIPLVCSRYGSGGAAPVGRRRRGDRTASRRLGSTGRALVGLERSAGTSMAPPYRRYLPSGTTTLLAGFRVVKAQNRPCDQPAAASHCHGSLSSKPHLCVEGGGQPLVILTGEPRHGGHNRYRSSAGGVPRVRGWRWAV